jgi:hypothetical protein
MLRPIVGIGGKALVLWEDLVTGPPCATRGFRCWIVGGMEWNKAQILILLSSGGMDR